MLQPPPFDFDVQPKAGLSVRMAGVPVVRGSYFQYYEPGWTKGYFSSLWGGQSVRRIDANTVELTFRSGDASGRQLYRRQGDRLLVEYRFEWAGARPVRVELAAGLISASALEAGELTAAGRPTRSLTTYLYSGPGFEQRRFSPDAPTYLFRAPLGEVEVRGSRALTLFDARGYNQDWARGRNLWWLGGMDLEVSKEKPLEMQVEWRLAPSPTAPVKVVRANLRPQKVPNALNPDESLPLLIPKPKDNRLDFNRTLTITGAWRFPAGRFAFFSQFIADLKRRYALPLPAKGAPAIAADGGIIDKKMVYGGYRITITPKSISVLGEQQEGLRMGLRRLASLAFVRNGRLVLPTGTLVDWPSVNWRGVHLFIGPRARPFQRRLWERVLLPMGFNRVVLQCERTAWKAIPGTATSITTSRKELASLFDMYREIGVEPIPLIQSWGHMEWLFANGKNLGLAFNPQVPYAIDPRKAEARNLISRIWDEAVELLQPQALHFGLDEVDMRGGPEDEALLTAMWRDYLPFLGKIAERHRATPMLWADKALAPGEAVDATHAPTKAEAEARRAAIPRNAAITDWHYRADPRPQTFYPVLQLWKGLGLRAIASAWYRPENVRGFALAAELERTGYLQTTWAGYESTEEAMLQQLQQFTAMVLAGDYTWSGRQEELYDLGYDAAEVFRRLYFAPTSPVSARSGRVFGEGREARVGGVRFALFEPLSLRSSVLADRSAGPSTIEVPLSGGASHLALALDAAVRGEEGEPVAEVVAELADGRRVTLRLLYGRHVRTADDPAASPYAERAKGLSAVRLPLGPKPAALRRLTLTALSPQAGVRLHGVTAW